MARAQCDRPLVMISKVFSLYKMDALMSLLDDAHSLQLHMSAEKSAAAVVLPINTKKLANSFNFFKNGEFSPKHAISHKIFQI
jgi:hypothetical protein